jgi:hypothetical protein
MVLSYRFEPGFYGKSDLLVKAIRRKRESPLQVLETQSAIPPRSQRNVCRRRDVRL